MIPKIVDAMLKRYTFLPFLAGAGSTYDSTYRCPISRATRNKDVTIWIVGISLSETCNDERNFATRVAAKNGYKRIDEGREIKPHKDSIDTNKEHDHIESQAIAAKDSLYSREAKTA